MEDVFPSDILFSSLQILKQCKSDYNLLDITIDSEAIFAEKMKRQTAKEEGRDYYEPFETSDTLRPIRELKQAQIIKDQLKLYVNNPDLDNMRVGEAVVAFQKAQQLGQLSSAEYYSLIDLMIVTDKRQIR